MNDYKSILVGIAEAEIGTREQGGNNRGGRVVAYQKATWLEPDAWPWCAAFVCWRVKEWLGVPGVAESIGVGNVEKWRPSFNGAARLLARKSSPSRPFLFAPIVASMGPRDCSRGNA